MSRKQLVFFACMLFVPFNSYGDVGGKDDTGWFVGGLVGTTSTNTEMKNTFSQNKNTGVYGAYGGYNFTDWFGLEGSYFNTVDVSDSRTNLIKASYFGLTIAPKVTYRVTPFFSIYAKAGLAYLNYKETYDNVIFFVRGTEQTWSGITSTLGVGGQFDIKYGIKVRIGFDRVAGSIGSNDKTSYNDIANIDAKLNSISLGVHYQF